MRIRVEFSCGHTLFLPYGVVKPFVEEFITKPSVDRAHCPACERLDLQAEKEEVVRLMERGLRGA